ncbi:MAG: LysR family transcriptional regulator [Deltaproteobacteria bacterium]|nr:MAG: LysR family transcriptional regulator [Deltaproteobacteria bacterium]
MNDFRVRSKVWLEFRGQPFLGDGRYRLLSAVEQTGSINAAAKKLGMSYRKAWSQLNAMDEHAPFPLFEKRTGGKGGGATHLTQAALDLLQNFEKLRESVNANADFHFEEIFQP